MAIAKAETFLVGVDFSNGIDVGVMIVGKKKQGEEVEVINAFQGNEAYELYKKLTSPSNNEKKTI